MEKPDGFRRSRCAIANTLDLVGDKWSLLVIRDLLRGKRTYGELAESPERIPTNILADRLKRLEEAGIIARTPYQQRPARYSYALTAKGAALGDVLLALVGFEVDDGNPAALGEVVDGGHESFGHLL